tara:strand:- start:2118 stop:2312 length:195 start_codon:yes stop_codon:yes gene_type:complete
MADNVDENSIVWNGENLIEISDFLGHEDFHHKQGVLYVSANGRQITFQKGACILVSKDGELTCK